MTRRLVTNFRLFFQKILHYIAELLNRHAGWNTHNTNRLAVVSLIVSVVDKSNDIAGTNTPLDRAYVLSSGTKFVQLIPIVELRPCMQETRHKENGNCQAKEPDAPHAR